MPAAISRCPSVLQMKRCKWSLEKGFEEMSFKLEMDKEILVVPHSEGYFDDEMRKYL